jgi:hypothetical protein
MTALEIGAVILGALWISQTVVFLVGYRRNLRDS